MCRHFERSDISWFVPFLYAGCRAEDEAEDVEPPKADPDLGASREAVRTDAEAMQKYQPTNQITPLGKLTNHVASIFV